MSKAATEYCEARPYVTSSQCDLSGPEPRCIVEEQVPSPCVVGNTVCETPEQGIPCGNIFCPPVTTVSCEAPQVTCSPNIQSVEVNQPVTITAEASGGTGLGSDIFWSGGGSPTTGIGPAFTTSFSATGEYQVQAFFEGATDTCQVTVYANVPPSPCQCDNWSVTENSCPVDTTPTCTGRFDCECQGGPPPPPPPTVQCSPGMQTVLVNESAQFTALTSGGSGGVVFWNSPGGTPASGTGNSFSASFSSNGTFFVTAVYEGESSSCEVSVTQPPPISVSLAATPANVDYNGTSTLSWIVNNATSCSATAGPWSGSKSAAGGSESTGPLTSSQVYEITCSGPGGTASDTATVTVGSELASVSCAPAFQTVGVLEQANFFATTTGGTGGPVFWNASFASPDFGVGEFFSTSYTVAGRFYVTVTYEGAASTCEVDVAAAPAPPPPPPPAGPPPPGPLTCFGVICLQLFNTASDPSVACDELKAKWKIQSPSQGYRIYGQQVGGSWVKWVQNGFLSETTFVPSSSEPRTYYITNMNPAFTEVTVPRQKGSPENIAPVPCSPAPPPPPTGPEFTSSNKDIIAVRGSSVPWQYDNIESDANVSLVQPIAHGDIIKFAITVLNTGDSGYTGNFVLEDTMYNLGIPKTGDWALELFCNNTPLNDPSSCNGKVGLNSLNYNAQTNVLTATLSTSGGYSFEPGHSIIITYQAQARAPGMSGSSVFRFINAATINGAGGTPLTTPAVLFFRDLNYPFILER